MHLGVMAIQFAVGGMDGKLPVNLDLLGLPLSEQRQHLARQLLDLGNTPIETLPRDKEKTRIQSYSATRLIWVCK